MKNKIYNQFDICKQHKNESDFICSCGEVICTSCIDTHKNHSDFVLKSKKNILQELSNEIKELELNYEYISNSLPQEKIIYKLSKELTHKFFRKELKSSKDKETLKKLSDHKLSLNIASLHYKYDHKFPDNFHIKSHKIRIDKIKRTLFKKIDKMQKLADKILNTKNLFEAEFEKLLTKYFALDESKMDIDEIQDHLVNNVNNVMKPQFNGIDNFQFTIGANKNLNVIKKILSPFHKEFVQSFYSDQENDKEKEINRYMDKNRDIDRENNQLFDFKKLNFNELGSQKIYSECQLPISDIQIPLSSINNFNFNSEIFDDKFSVGIETEKSKESVDAIFSNYKNDINCFPKNKNGDDPNTRPASLSNFSKSPARNKSPVHNTNRISRIVETEIDMICSNLHCGRAYKVKKGEEKWKKKCLTCYKVLKA